ncbi:MAG TPA: hypothetical protein VKV32_04415 [Stellaceae bacterium]|nr:hypothetical protein [Stellaceae bacterium]
MRTKSFLVAVLLTALALPAFAISSFGQAPAGGPPPTTNVRGKIVKLDGQNLTVKTREGSTVNVALAPNAQIRALKTEKLSDIKQGDFIASTSMKGKDGKLHAIEIHTLPPAAPELQIPYDYAQGSIMTNAHVSGIAKAKSGNVVSVTYKGQSTDIVVDNKTKIVAPTDAAMSDLKPGKAVFIRANKGGDGSLSANNVTVEKNGVKPPM